MQKRVLGCRCLPAAHRPSCSQVGRLRQWLVAEGKAARWLSTLAPGCSLAGTWTLRQAGEHPVVIWPCQGATGRAVCVSVAVQRRERVLWTLVRWWCPAARVSVEGVAAALWRW